MTALSTHILDLARGCPAANVLVVAYRLAGEIPVRLIEQRTNADGRARLVEAGDLVAGRYVLAFHVGEYFKATGAPVTDPPFLDRISIEFAVADPAQHHHVPLLVSPFGYSTYRGS